MTQLGKENGKINSQPLAFIYGFLTVILWLATIILGALGITAIRETVIALFVQFVVGDRTAAYFWGAGVAWVNWVVFSLAIVLVVFTIFSGEYHLKHYRTPQSKRLFKSTLAVELAILGLSYAIQAAVAAT